MKNLSEILCEDCICMNIPVRSKPAVIRELVALMAENERVTDPEALIEALMVRERIQTTGIGHGMALPHATAEGVKGLIMALGISREGVDFESLDNQPVQLIFLLAGEPRLQTSFLSILSKISRFFRKEEFRNRVLKAGSNQEIIALIRLCEER